MTAAPDDHPPEPAATRLGDPLQVRLAETPGDWAQALAIRYSVFVREQGVPVHEELDDRDPVAVHVLALLDGRPAGTGRYYVADGAAVIGRMAVRPWARGSGVGSAILRGLMAHARRAGLARARLAAQLHALAFYARHGFVAEGDEFMDAGIPHRWMERPL